MESKERVWLSMVHFPDPRSKQTGATGSKSRFITLSHLKVRLSTGMVSFSRRRLGSTACHQFNNVLSLPVQHSLTASERTSMERPSGTRTTRLNMLTGYSEQWLFMALTTTWNTTSISDPSCYQTITTRSTTHSSSKSWRPQARISCHQFRITTSLTGEFHRARCMMRHLLIKFMRILGK